MTPILATVLATGVLLLLAVAGVRIAFALMTAGVAGLLMLRSVDVTGAYLGSVPYSAVSNFSYIVVPMFILMGMVALRGAIATNLYSLAGRHLGWLPGGIGLATVAAAAGFAAVTGSSVATVATLGKLCITEMERQGYPRYLAAGIIGAAGTLGILIPPSIMLVIFGIVVRESIGALLLAGIIPGILSALLYGTLVMFIAPRMSGTPRHPDSGNPSGDTQDGTAPAFEQETGAARQPSEYWSILEVGIIFAIVMGGIYSGTFTVSESGALGAGAAILLLSVKNWRRLGRFLQQVWDGFLETANVNAMAFTILMGATFFSSFLIIGGIPSSVASWAVALDLPPTVIVIVLLALLIPLGMFLEPVSIVVIAAPLLYEPITALGYSGVWLGIIFVKLLELALITPPIGVNAYVVAGTVPGLRVETVFRGLSPFYLVDLATIGVLFAFPALVLWLPAQAA